MGDLDEECRLLVGMAVCHELSKIDGEIMGDPLDVKIFESTGWTLEQDGEEENQVVSRRHSLLLLLVHICRLFFTVKGEGGCRVYRCTCKQCFVNPDPVDP